MLLLVDCYTVVMLLFLVPWDAQLIKKKICQKQTTGYIVPCQLYIYPYRVVGVAKLVGAHS